VAAERPPRQQPFAWLEHNLWLKHDLPSQRAMRPNLPRMTLKRGREAEFPISSASGQIPAYRLWRTLIRGREAIFRRQAVTAADGSTLALNCAYVTRPASRRRAAASLAATRASSGRRHAW
jgi:hypothetical protein